MRRTFLIAWVAMAVPACVPAAVPPSIPAGTTEVRPENELDLLLGLMRDRLAVMHDVARAKWPGKTPIEDPEREAALLRDVVDRGTALGLDPETTRAFFAAQIEAAKRIQRADFARWESGRDLPQGDPPDLASELRPRIDALNRDLLKALAASIPKATKGIPTAARVARRANVVLTGESIDDRIRAICVRPLVEAVQ